MLRKPNSIPEGDTVIEDPAMEPFFISKSSSSGYTVYERVIKGQNNTPYIKTVCYPSTFSSALKKVATELLNAKSNHYPTIKSYISEYNSIQKKLDSLVDI